MDRAEDAIKLFAITSQLIEHDLDRVEREYAIDLRRDHRSTADVDEAYYPQIESAIRAEAASMAPHYEMFYSLETTIRRLVRDQLQEAREDWWDERVPDLLRKEAEKRQKKEIESGVTPRSDEPIDFPTFGELGQIITSTGTCSARVLELQGGREGYGHTEHGAGSDRSLQPARAG